MNIQGYGGQEQSQPAAYAPREIPDSLSSKTNARAIDILCEGPIVGLVDGMRSVFVNRTPLVGGVDADGNDIFNFQETTIIFNTGTQSQAAVGGIFSKVENEVTDNNRLVTNVDPYTFSINDTSYSFARVNIKVPNLTSQADNGDLLGAHTVFRLTGRSGATGPWVEIGEGNYTIAGKSSAQYQRSVYFDLKNSLGPGPWEVRVERPIPDTTTVKIQDKFYVISHTLIKDHKLTYPNTAYVAFQANAVSFTQVPSRSYLIYGSIVRVPSNYTPRSYNPTTKVWTPATYTGSWDGTFKPAWTDNPAWCLFDLLTEKRYGLGRFLDDTMVDKWSLYDIARYCDELVPDGFGGYEPRYTCNMVLATREEAYKVVQNFAAIFRGMAYWASGAMYALTDRPTDPVFLFTEAKVVDGLFTYATAGDKARHNMALVAWNDPANHYEQKIEYVELADDIVDRGDIYETNVAAIGCTSQGQANRVGRWLLYTEYLESETVTFRVALESALVAPGDVIEIQDQSRASKRFGGILADATTTQVTLDAPVTLETGKSYRLWTISPDGIPMERDVMTIAPYTGSVLTIGELPTAPTKQSTWILSANDLKPTTWRILSIKQADADNADIVAIRHDPSKYSLIEQNLHLELPITNGALSVTTVEPIWNPHVVESQYVTPLGSKTRVQIIWESDPYSAAFWVDYQKDSGEWLRLPKVTNPTVTMDDAIPGDYLFRIYAISPTGMVTEPKLVHAIIDGKTAPPDNVLGFQATPALTSVSMTWTPVTNDDLDYYEIRQGASWAAGTVVVTGLKASAFTWQRPGAGAYTLWIAAKDTSGNWSAAPSQATMTVVADDDLLAPSEKQDIKGWYDRIKAEQTGLVAQAAQMSVSSTAYTNAISTIEGQLAGTGEWHSSTWDSFATVTSLGAGGGATFRANQASVETQRDALTQILMGSALGKFQEWTSPGSYSWVCPAGVTSVDVVVVGGGGGGAAGTTNTRGGGGGGGGGVVSTRVTVIPGTTYTVIVGAAGVGGTSSGANGTNGGDSQFKDGTTVFADGRGGAAGMASGLGGTGGGAYIPSGGIPGSTGGSVSATAGIDGTNSVLESRNRIGTLIGGGGGGGACSSLNYKGGDGGDGPATTGILGGPGNGPNAAYRAGGGGGASGEGGGGYAASSPSSVMKSVGGGGGGGQALAASYASGGDGSIGFVSLEY